MYSVYKDLHPSISNEYRALKISNLKEEEYGQTHSGPRGHGESIFP